MPRAGRSVHLYAACGRVPVWAASPRLVDSGWWVDGGWWMDDGWMVSVDGGWWWMVDDGWSGMVRCAYGESMPVKFFYNNLYWLRKIDLNLSGAPPLHRHRSLQTHPNPLPNKFLDCFKN